MTAAEYRINEAWEKVAACVGDNEWGTHHEAGGHKSITLNRFYSGKALKEISKRNDEILAIEKEWVQNLPALARFIELLFMHQGGYSRNLICTDDQQRALAGD